MCKCEVIKIIFKYNWLLSYLPAILVTSLKPPMPRLSTANLMDFATKQQTMIQHKWIKF